jgi:peptide/nickel transport system ATP-binding protein
VWVGGGSIVEGVDLELSAARCVALVGRSGSGKSTLARALVGLETISGSLRFDGVELRTAPARELAALRRAVHLCWQEPRLALDPKLTVGQLLEQARVLSGRPAWPQSERDAVLSRLELAPALLPRRPGELSGGQRTRVSLARAWAAEPQILIADEVAASLDDGLAREVFGWCRELAPGLLWIGHRLDLVGPGYDEIVVLDAGRIVERGARVLEEPTHEATRRLVEATRRREAGPRI